MSWTLDIHDLRPLMAGARVRHAPPAHREWRGPFGFAHTTVVTGLLFGVTVWWLLGPNSTGDFGAGLLLVSGALIGLPHGSSDFLVARRLFAPRLGLFWLPAFVLVYLALVVAVLAAWLVAAAPTLLAFLLVSGLHFGNEDLQAYGGLPTRLRRIARITTPLVPIVMLHLSAVTPFFATMSGLEPEVVLASLQPFRLPLLTMWLAVIAATVMVDLTRCDGPRARRRLEACELFALGAAAAVLPPLLSFGLYFCLLHAVRHMAALTAQVHPCHGWRALGLATWVIVPSAGICLVALASFWSAVEGAIATDALLCRALQLVAALTIPHMLLEALDHRACGPCASRRVALATD